MTIQLLMLLDAFLVTNPTNIRYLTGFVGVSEKEREAYLLLTREKRYLFTSSLYRESARHTKCTFVEISIEKRFVTQLGGVMKKGRLGFEEKNLTVAEFEKLQKELPGVALVGTTDRIEAYRQIKRDDEILNIKEACRIGDTCLAAIIKEIKPGVTEGEIAWKIESIIRSKDAQVSFAPIVAFGPHSAEPHYAVSSRLSQSSAENQSLALKSNDIVLLDFGAKVNGYCSDITRVVFVGKPKPEWTRAYQTVFKAQQAAIQYLDRAISLGVYVTHTGGGLAGHRRKDNFPIVSGGRADKIAREIIEKAGFPTYPHSLGHNIGLSVHEGPRLSMKGPSTDSGNNLLPGMVFSVEPGIYIPGQYGIRIEDLIFLKKDGIEMLTSSSKEIIIL